MSKSILSMEKTIDPKMATRELQLISRLIYFFLFFIFYFIFFFFGGGETTLMALLRFHTLKIGVSFP